jgi:erythromycin esterase
MIRTLLPAVLLLAAAQPVTAQIQSTDWLRQHSIAISGEPVTPDDFRDFEPLTTILAGVRVILLGELTHGDGAGSAVKARLIRFLHQRLGFSVVVWEAGFYECHRTNELLSQATAAIAASAECLWPFWSESGEIISLFEYTLGSWQTDLPLLMAGLDLQFSGPSVEPRVQDLEQWFDRAPRPLFENRGTALQERIRRDALLARAPELLERFEEDAEAMRHAHGSREAARIERVLRNMAEYQLLIADRDRSFAGGPDSAAAFIRAYNRRERVNAESLLWLANTYYAGRKVVVWLHNVHAANSRIGPDYRSLSVTDTAQSLESTGRLIKLALGEAVYSVATIASAGEWGFPGHAAEPIPEPAAMSLETWLSALGDPVRFLNLRATERNHWLYQPLLGSLSAQVPGARYPIVWPATFDGILFFQRMLQASPVRRRNASLKVARTQCAV